MLSVSCLPFSNTSFKVKNHIGRCLTVSADGHGILCLAFLEAYTGTLAHRGQSYEQENCKVLGVYSSTARHF